MRSAMFLALGLSLIPLAAMSQNSSSTPPAAQSATPEASALPTEKTEVTADAPKFKIICIRRPAETGSHFGGGKECHTENEWTMEHNMSIATLERLRAVQNAAELRAIQSGGR